MAGETGNALKDAMEGPSKAVQKIAKQKKPSRMKYIGEQPALPKGMHQHYIHKFLQSGHPKEQKRVAEQYQDKLSDYVYNKAITQKQADKYWSDFQESISQTQAYRETWDTED